MTTDKKKSANTRTTKPRSSMSEPATATKTVKAPAAAKLPTPAPRAEAPVAPTVAAALANQTQVATPAIAPSPKAETVVTPAVATQAASEQPLTIGMFQKRLYELGFYGGHWDGNYGPLTKQAVCRFQASQGLAVDGEPTPATLSALGF